MFQRSVKECQIFTWIVPNEQNWRSQNIDCSNLKKLFPGQFLVNSNSLRGLGAKACVAFNFEKNYDVFKSKS